MSNVVTRMYGQFRGVDFRGEEVNLSRSPDSVNMWKDYKTTESIRTRPSLELKHSFDSPVYGVFFYKLGEKTRLLVHAGTDMYEVEGDEHTKISDGIMLNEAVGNSFVYNEVFYFMDGKSYLYYDTETSKLKTVVPYVPTTSIGGKGVLYGEEKIPGTPLEDVNLITAKRKNTFTFHSANGLQMYYFKLDAESIDKVTSVKVNGDEVADYNLRIDLDEGVVRVEGFALGDYDAVIEYEKNVEGYADRINKCTLLQVFDNRVFVSGNPDFPNVLWHCSLNDPTYFSDLDYYNEGLDESQIRGLVAGNNTLWVFRKPSSENTNIFYHTPVTDATYGKIYPGSHSSISTGCIGRAVNFNDDIVFFSDRGMEGISSEINTEQVIGHRSTLVDSKLTAEPHYKDMLLAEWEGYLLVCIDKKIYLADSRAMFTNVNHIEYDWYYWELEHNITCVKSHEGKLYVGTDGGIYSFDGEGDVKSHWVTPKDKFNAPQFLKTTNKRGFVVEAMGDISVATKIDSDADFVSVDTYHDVTDYFVSRIKRKKFKDLQIKFSSDTRFSLETATLEAFIGGYVKR